MATPTMKTGDTWPPLRGSAADADGLLSLVDADAVNVLIRHRSSGTLITGAAEVIDPPEEEAGNLYNWRYHWAEGDLDAIGDYQIELEIVWNDATDPPRVQTVPSKDYQKLKVVQDLGGSA